MTARYWSFPIHVLPILSLHFAFRGTETRAFQKGFLRVLCKVLDRKIEGHPNSVRSRNIPSIHHVQYHTGHMITCTCILHGCTYIRQSCLYTNADRYIYTLTFAQYTFSTHTAHYTHIYPAYIYIHMPFAPPGFSCRTDTILFATFHHLQKPG